MFTWTAHNNVTRHLAHLTYRSDLPLAQMKGFLPMVEQLESFVDGVAGDLVVMGSEALSAAQAGIPIGSVTVG